MNILIAPNAFKNSLTATQVAVAIEQGLKLSKLKCDTTCFPIADGGDGLYFLSGVGTAHPSFLQRGSG